MVYFFLYSGSHPFSLLTFYLSHLSLSPFPHSLPLYCAAGAPLSLPPTADAPLRPWIWRLASGDAAPRRSRRCACDGRRGGDRRRRGSSVGGAVVLAELGGGAGGVARCDGNCASRSGEVGGGRHRAGLPPLAITMVAGRGFLRAARSSPTLSLSLPILLAFLGPQTAMTGGMGSEEAVAVAVAQSGGTTTLALADGEAAAMAFLS